ncbi:cupin domain-containing protein [Halodesulfovibrio sp.]|jgi:ethanolamine utilization protein EutQ|uniref:cupin domain-containing protein n=1 Tax=Halodesulfovibrio sp. TaxID=1912772 RepID=UPI0025FEB9C2|nr:cupin domain-containing protein [Halodesulfovibrio sp.]MCT4535113.1 cupin domain-containing protein [Halodesulfovibrio sp.]
MKKVICAKDVETLIEQGKSTLYIDANTILTPSAKDAAKLAEIEIVEGAPPQAPCAAPAAPSCDGAISSDLIYAALKALYERGMLDEFLKDIVSKGYVSQAVGGGKIVRGNSVKMEPFETGTPGATACSQEVIGKNDGQIHSGFFEIDQSRFEQDFACEANFHLLEGALNITINGQTVSAEAGDVFCVPAGAKVIWEATNHARLFYSRFPQSKG